MLKDGRVMVWGQLTKEYAQRIMLSALPYLRDGSKGCPAFQVIDAVHVPLHLVHHHETELMI